MAVQAQYPSNFLISSDAQQGDEQPSQSEGQFLDNTPMFFDGTDNPQKRSKVFDTGLHLSFGIQEQLQSSQSVDSFPIMDQNFSQYVKQQCNELQYLLQTQVKWCINPFMCI